MCKTDDYGDESSWLVNLIYLPTNNQTNCAFGDNQISTDTRFW